MLPHHRRVLAVAALTLAASAAGASAFASGRDDPQAQIAFRRFLDLENTTGAIFVADAHGGHVRQVTTPLPGGLDNEPSWTPDGRRILFTRQPADEDGPFRDFWTVRADGSDARLLSPGCPRVPTPCLGNEQRSQPRYSPDGRQISYNWAAGDVRDDIGQIEFSELYVMNADGSHPHALTSFTADDPYGSDNGNATWSPDSRTLVFNHLTSPVGTPASSTAMFLIGRDGSGLRQLTPYALRAGGRAAWFPDGRTIAFRTVPADDAPGGDIYTIRSNGTGLRQLTHFAPAQLGELAVSPDGRQIVFSRGGDRRDLYVMRADGGHIRQITQTDLSENWPDWRPFR